MKLKNSVKAQTISIFKQKVKSATLTLFKKRRILLNVLQKKTA